MRRVMALVLLFFSTYSLACSPGNLYFEPVFNSNKDHLSPEEINRFSDWRADQRVRYPNGGEIYIEVEANAIAGVSHELAERRLIFLINLLQNLGIKKIDIKDAGVFDRNIGKKYFDNAKSRGLVTRYINTARISIEPRCPHPCCPGLQPIRPGGEG